MGIPDVDIDVVDRTPILELFKGAIRASQLTAGGHQLVQHNTGVHFQRLPSDPLTGLSTFPYDMAEELGYYKIDFIPFHIYENITDDNHLSALVTFAESDMFPWELFSDSIFFDNDDHKKRITHLGNYFDLCQIYPPHSVMDVAVLIALIRPRKKYLIGGAWGDICKVIWKNIPEEDTGDAGNYFFKKSHAVGYALAVLVHLQLLVELL